jgi:hypothetical protein
VEGLSDVYKLVKDNGMFLETCRTEGVSTTEIISRVLRDYDGFVKRNLKKGCSPRDLNIKSITKVEKIFLNSITVRLIFFVFFKGK